MRIRQWHAVALRRATRSFQIPREIDPRGLFADYGRSALYDLSGSVKSKAIVAQHDAASEAN
jgi:hypothetical protein